MFSCPGRKDTSPVSGSVEALQNNFYMDDLMTGADTEEGCYQLQKEINVIMDSAKLPIRKWFRKQNFK